MNYTLHLFNAHRSCVVHKWPGQTCVRSKVARQQRQQMEPAENRFSITLCRECMLMRWHLMIIPLGYSNPVLPSKMSNRNFHFFVQ